MAPLKRLFFSSTLLFSTVLAQTPTTRDSAAGESIVSQIYGYQTTDLAALGTQAPSAISALAATIPPASIIAMESKSSLLFKSQTTSTPPKTTSPPIVSDGSSAGPTNTRNIILGAVLGFVGAFALVCFVMYCLNVRRKRNQRGLAQNPRNPYLDIEKDFKPLDRSRSTRQLDLENKSPVIMAAGYDDLHMLGADGAYNNLFKTTQAAARKKRGSRGSKRLSAGLKSSHSRRDGIDVNKPLPVPKLTLSKDPTGRSFVDSETSSNPFNSPLHSPQRSASGMGEIPVFFAPPSPHRGKESASSLEHGHMADRPASPRRTLTAPPPAVTQAVLYTPSVYSSEWSTEVQAPSSLLETQIRPMSRSPSVPLPRRSSKRKSRVEELTKGAHVRVSSEEARSFSFHFSPEEPRKDSVASVSSEIKREAQKPKPLRISRPSQTSMSDVAENGLESPPWPPTRFSMGRDRK